MVVAVWPISPGGGERGRVYLPRGKREAAKLGVPRNYFGFHDGVDKVGNAGLEVLKQLGATLKASTTKTSKS